MSKKGNGYLVLSLDLKIYEMKDGLITGFVFDDRIFKETGRLSDIKIIKEKPKIEVLKKVPIKVPKKVFDKVSEKHCPKCDTTKPVKDFNKSSCDHTGYQSYCRDCSNKTRAVNKEKQTKYKDKFNFVEPKEQPDKPVLKSRKDAFQWNKEKDKIICDNFGTIGVGGIYDKSLFPGLSLAEIRKRCQELNLIDQFGNTK